MWENSTTRMPSYGSGALMRLPRCRRSWAGPRSARSRRAPRRGAPPREHAADLDRIGIAHGVREAHRIHAGFGQAVRDLEYPVLLHFALQHAAEGGSDPDLDQRARGGGLRVAQLADLAGLLDRLLAS